MSSLGAGRAVVSASAAQAAGTTATGIALGAVAIGGAVVGAGILVARGIMWCGEKMEENYQHRCQEWTDLSNASRAESRANVQEMSSYMSTQLEVLSASEFASAPQRLQISVSQHELNKAISLAKMALMDTTHISQNKVASEHTLLASRLRAGINAGRDILPSELITDAETMLNGSTENLKTMLSRLNQAWNELSDRPAQQAHTIQETQQMLTLVATKLRAIDGIIRDSGATRNLEYQKRLRHLENQAIEARDELRIDPKQAHPQTIRVQQEVDEFLGEVSRNAHHAWNEMRTKVNIQIGILEALLTMVQEADVIQLIDTERLGSLKQRIVTLQQKVRLLLEGTSQQIQDDLNRLATGVELLRQDVFTQVKSGQQQTLAILIQNTLTELGFTSEIGEAPTLEINGEMTRVEVMASPEKASGEREDRLITFDISREGKISYDFAGYVGNACLTDAQQIFGALRDKGIFLMDEHALNNLQQLSAENLVTEIMKQEQFQVELKQNKTQAELAEHLQHVLGEMGYPNIRTSSIGGSIELEAFEGQIGYRVILSPEGEVQVLKNANQVDVSENKQDQVVQASQIVQQESKEAEVKERKRSYMASRKGQMLSH